MQRFILLTCLTAFVMASPAFAQRTEDVVYLKDGGLVRGAIIEQIPGVSLKIKTREGNVFVYTMDEIAKVSKQTVKKNPYIASGLSLLVPGAGQVYNRQFKEGLSYFGGAIIGIGIMFVSLEDDYKIVRQDGYKIVRHTVDPDDDNLLLGLGYFSWAFSHVFSVLEPFSSDETDEQNQQLSYGHLIELGGSRTTLGVDPVVSHKNLGPRLTLHF